MTQERIDVVVTDEVNQNIEGKLLGIANASDKADTAVGRLKAQLASLKSSSLGELKLSFSTPVVQIKEQITALRTYSNTLRALTENNNRFVASMATSTAAVRAEVAAVNDLIRAYRDLNGLRNGAGGPGGGGGPGTPGVPDVGPANAALGDLTTAAKQAADALRLINPGPGPAPGPGPSPGPSGGASNSFTRYGGAADIRELGSAAGLASHHMSNLGFQINDVIVSLASGQRPFTVFIQQGAQIQQIYSQTGLTIGRFASSIAAMLGLVRTTTESSALASLNAARQAQANVVAANAQAQANVRAAETNIAVATAQAGMATTANEAAIAQVRLAAAQEALAAANSEAAITAMAVSTANARAATAGQAAAAATRTSLTLLGGAALVVAGIVGGLAVDFTNIKNNTPDSEVKAFANTLGLTHKEMKKLKDETVTYGDVFAGLKQTFADTFDLGQPLGTAWNAIKQFFADADRSGRQSAANIYGAIVGSYRGIVATWRLWPSAIGDLFVQGVNLAITAIEALANKSISAINSLGGQANKILPDSLKVPTLDTVSLGRMTNQFEGSAQNVANVFRTEVDSATSEASGAIGKFYSDWDKNTTAAWQKRMRQRAAEIIADRTPRTPKKEADPKTQADYLDDENKKLDNQLSRMKMLKDAREEQQQLDQIEEAFAKRRMPLDAAQLEGFRARIHAIQEFKYQQTEMDRIYETANGPLRTYNASLAAAKDLLDRGAISQAAYNQEVNRAGRAFAEASDPLFAMKEALTQAENASKLYGKAVEDGAYAEQLRQAFLAKGIDITKNATAAQMEEYRAILARNQALSQQQYVQQELGGIVNPMIEDNRFLASKADFYREIDRLRQADLISEEQAQRAKAQLQNEYDAIRFRGATTFFENLSQLSASKNGELAAIGKAAAVADATIKGYQAVQNALASVPYPFNIAAAAAMAASTGVQVANIISTPTNVGSFNNGGSFVVGGEHGIDQNTIAMNVSRGERVSIETPGQQRANDSTGEGGGIRALKIVNVTDKRDMLAAMSDEEGTELIMNAISKNRRRVDKILGAGR